MDRPAIAIRDIHRYGDDPPLVCESLTSATGSRAATGSPLSTPTTRIPGSGPATREPSPATTRDPASSTSAGTAEAPCPCS